MTSEKIRSLARAATADFRHRLHAVLSAEITSPNGAEPDRKLQRLLDRFAAADGDDAALHATLDLAAFCSRREILALRAGRPSDKWARAKRCADHLAVCHLALLKGDRAEAMMRALTALEQTMDAGTVMRMGAAANK